VSLKFKINLPSFKGTDHKNIQTNKNNDNIVVVHQRFYYCEICEIHNTILVVRIKKKKKIKKRDLNCINHKYNW